MATRPGTGRKTAYVYAFGGGKAAGDGSMGQLLGGKGANLAEMSGHPKLRLPVPPGFTITTDVCAHYYRHRRRYPTQLRGRVESALKQVERLVDRRFGDSQRPLLVSVRSGARQSMPGMMETVLNVGLTSKTLPGLIEASGSERFAYDAYRRLITMYADVVMEKAAGVESREDNGIRRQLEHLLDVLKKRRGYSQDTDLTAADLRKLCDQYRQKVIDVLGKPFPDDPIKQLWGGISAVFESWNGKRAAAYRRIERIPDAWGTAVNVQAMVFGNMGNDCATGVAFTRDPGNGRNIFYGEYLVNAQGEDVVAGIRTPAPINRESQSDRNDDLVTLQEAMPRIYRELVVVQKRLEKHYRDMQDLEFTIENGKLYLLQCRVGKRNGRAAVRVALDMLRERLISRREAVMRVTPAQLGELLHPILDPSAESAQEPIAKGLPAGPGGAAGVVVLTANEAVEWAEQGRRVVLLREETNPEDVEGMRAAQAVLTARGGMTSHAALVARGWGRCCIVGCAELQIDVDRGTVNANGRTLRRGDWLSLNGTRGLVYEGELPMIDADDSNTTLERFLKICDSIRRLRVRANADTPGDARRARRFGAEGIGLFRTEHMFYGEGAEVPLFKLRKVIVSRTVAERRKALNDLYPHIKADIKATLEAMDGLPVTIRLLDPPLHEFVPHGPAQKQDLARAVGISVRDLNRRCDNLAEVNPMMGHRGVRLGVSHPEITETQVRAIFEAAAELQRRKRPAVPEIMIPVVVHEDELANQVDIIKEIYREVLTKYRLRKIPHLVGTMIEVPRAVLVADRIAGVAEFFSFGTNDLTQMTFGFSRDDIGSFLPDYLENQILPDDPFQTIDQRGIGELIRTGIERGRQTKPNLKIGICGEHGGDPESVKFFHDVGMDYVSCSPYRVPIARLAAAQAIAADNGTATRQTNGRKKLPAKKKTAKKKTAKKKAAKKKAAKKKTATKKTATEKPAKKSKKKTSARKKSKARRSRS